MNSPYLPENQSFDYCLRKFYIKLAQEFDMRYRQLMKSLNDCR